MKSQDIRNMTIPEIENKVLTLKEQLFQARTEITTGRVERPHTFKLLRKDIARCNTILKEKKSGKDKTQ